MPNNELLPSSGSALTIQTPQGLGSLSLGIQRQVRREVEKVQSKAVVAKLIEDGRAHLAHTALDNIGALSAFESHLITIAPLGEARYREIVDSYTLGASAAIRRWS